MSKNVAIYLIALSLVGWSSFAWAGSSAVDGKVVDKDGKGIQGVMVSAFDHDAAMGVTVHTSADGTFKISGLNPATYELRARLIGLDDEYVDDVELASGATKTGIKIAMRITDDANSQRIGRDLMSLMKWDDPKDKRNFKMSCGYCHQVGTIGFRSPEEPVDWETMVTRMDGFGGLYKHTQESIVERLLTAYSPEAEENWPKYDVPAAPAGKALNATVTEWDMGRQDACMIHDLELGADGLVYIVDMINDAIMTVDPETGEREVYGVPGGKDPNTDATPIKGPHSIERAPDGTMWITLALSGQMAKFDPKTKEWTQVSSAPAPRSRGAYPHTLRITDDGTVWYTDVAMGVFSMDPETMEVTGYKLPKKDQAVGAGKGESRGITPYGIDIAPDGTIWYSKLNGNRIGRLDPKTGDVKEWNPPFRGPRRLHVAPDGIVWVPGFGSGVIASFDPKTEEWEVIELPDSDNQIPYALNINPYNGDVWICGTGSDSLFRYVPKTKEMTEYRMPSRVTYTREVEFDEEGNIWVCNSNYPARHIERGRGSVIKIAVNN